jgi:hypothetical protein
VSAFILIGADLLAISLLVFAVYFPRHHRRDMIVAFLGINTGVLGVTYAMANAEISLGFGLGIFAVLSIIRLRSYEMNHVEIAYYFVAIAMGLLGGFPSSASGLTLVLMGILAFVVVVGDHPALLKSFRHQVVVLDRVITDEAILKELLASTLGGKIHSARVTRVDLVRERMVCDVRFSCVSSQPSPTRTRVTSTVASR